MSDKLFFANDHETELGPEEKLGLIPNLSTRAELNRAEEINIHSARVWALGSRTLKRTDLLSDGFGRELHRRMFRHVWRWAGVYRTTEKNLGWEAHRLAEGVRNIYDDAQTWVQYRTFSLKEIAVRLHHRLVVVHPWSNGNGRHARLMADIVIGAHREPELTWGAGSLMRMSELRRQYVAALRSADEGDYRALIEFAGR